MLIRLCLHLALPGANRVSESFQLRNLIYLPRVILLFLLPLYLSEPRQLRRKAERRKEERFHGKGVPGGVSLVSPKHLHMENRSSRNISRGATLQPLRVQLPTTPTVPILVTAPQHTSAPCCWGGHAAQGTGTSECEGLPTAFLSRSRT